MQNVVPIDAIGSPKIKDVNTPGTISTTPSQMDCLNSVFFLPNNFAKRPGGFTGLSFRRDITLSCAKPLITAPALLNNTRNSSPDPLRICILFSPDAALQVLLY